MCQILIADKQKEQISRKDYTMREISIRELAYNILLKWKLFLFFFAVCVLALVGYQIVGLQRQTIDEIQEDNDQTFTSEEMLQIEECYDAFLEFQASMEYRDDSIIMRIDPYHVNKVVNEYIISAEDYENLQAIVDSYSYFVSSGAVVSKEMEDTKHLANLITAEAGEVDISESSTGVAKAALMVEVIHEDEKQAEELSEEIDSEIKKYCKELNEKIGIHNIEKIMQNSIISSNRDLIGWQSQMRAAVENNKSNFESKRNSLSERQVAYLDSEYFKKEVGDLTLEENDTQKNISAKMLILDIIGAIIIAGIILVILYILEGRIYFPHSLERLYSLKILGILPEFYSQEKSKIKKRILKRMYNFNIVGSVEKEDYVKIICKDIKYFAEKMNIKKLFIQMDNFDHDSYIQYIIDYLRDQGMECTVGLNDLCKSKDLDALRREGSILFIKKSGKLTYKNMEQEMRLCSDNEIEVLGMVYVV